jgi:hypothetical protein
LTVNDFGLVIRYPEFWEEAAVCQGERHD